MKPGLQFRQKKCTYLLAVLLTATVAPAVWADTLFGIYAGAGSWQQSFDGDVQSADALTDIDVERDLGFDDDSNNVFYVAIEHPIPLLPNLRVQHTDLGTSGSTILTRTIEVQGTSFVLAEQIRSEVNLDQTDAVLYYELLDNWVSLDLGLSARYVDGSLRVQSTVQAAELEFSGVVPLLYGQARVDLPLTGLWLGVQAQGAAYGGDRVVDMTAQVAYESDLGLGVELGYRRFELKLDEFDDVQAAKLEIAGPYAAINYHF